MGGYIAAAAERTGLVVALVALAACGGSGGQTYAVPLATAQTELAAAPVPMMVFGSKPEMGFDTATAGPKVIWQVREGTKPILQYIAELKPVDAARTEVVMTMVGANEEVNDRLAKNRTIANLYRTAMAEQIAATLEHRPYDGTKIMGATLVAGMARMGSIRSDLDKAAEASRKQDKEIEAHRAQMIAAGQ